MLWKDSGFIFSHFGITDIKENKGCLREESGCSNYRFRYCWACCFLDSTPVCHCPISKISFITPQDGGIAMQIGPKYI